MVNLWTQFSSSESSHLICLLFLVKMEAEVVADQLSESFTPDDAFMFGPQSMLDFDQNQMPGHSKESLSFDGVFLLLLNWHVT